MFVQFIQNLPDKYRFFYSDKKNGVESQLVNQFSENLNLNKMVWNWRQKRKSKYQGAEGMVRKNESTLVKTMLVLVEWHHGGQMTWFPEIIEVQQFYIKIIELKMKLVNH